jgi:hypothetical protein
MCDSHTHGQPRGLRWRCADQAGNDEADKRPGGSASCRHAPGKISQCEFKPEICLLDGGVYDREALLVRLG